jgi:hypothetical protein
VVYVGVGVFNCKIIGTCICKVISYNYVINATRPVGAIIIRRAILFVNIFECVCTCINSYTIPYATSPTIIKVYCGFAFRDIINGNMPYINSPLRYPYAVPVIITYKAISQINGSTRIIGPYPY